MYNLLRVYTWEKNRFEINVYSSAYRKIQKTEIIEIKKKKICVILTFVFF